MPCFKVLVEVISLVPRFSPTRVGENPGNEVPFCQLIIGFSRCNFNLIQEFGIIFFVIPSLFHPGPIGLCISLILTHLKIGQDYCFRSLLAEITDSRL